METRPSGLNLINHYVRTLVGDPDVVLRINLDRVGIRPGIQVVTNLAQKFAVRAKLRELSGTGSVRGTCGIASGEHEYVPFGVNRYSRNLAKIKIRWKVQKIRHRTVLDFRDGRLLSTKRTDRRQQNKN
jgi:hypothetical protein